MTKVTRFLERAAGPADRLAGFIAHLRFNGIPAGLGEIETGMAALAAVDANRIDEARSALRAVCTGDADQERRFDDLFDAYWLNRGRRRESAPHVNASRNVRAESGRNYLIASSASDDRGESDTPDEDPGTSAHTGEGRLAASRSTNIDKTDLRRLMTPEDLKQAESVAEMIARSIRYQRSRRRKQAARGSLIDLRKVTRRSVSRGGEPIDLFYRRRPDRPVRIVALLDVSGSMTVYARVFLSFLKGLVAADQKTDAYLFHTKLACISDALRDGDTLRSVNRLSIMAQGFGGGTKIGSNLKLFNEQYAAQSVNGRTVVIILSDGYDTDPPELIADALARLKRRGARIIWLNPLKGWAGYEPVARGMAAAMPFLDHFAAANTLSDLAGLEPWLNAI